MCHRKDPFVTKLSGAAIVVAAAAGVLAAKPVFAQRDQSLEIDVSDCVEIESPAERFRCYESRADAALGEASPRAREEAPAAESSPARTPAEDKPTARPSAPSGGVIAEREIEQERSADAVRRRDDDDAREERREREQRREPEEFFGTVAAVEERLPSGYLITLENGQVWRQMRSRFYGLRPGHRVRIYSTGWGKSYRMSAEELNGFIQVERIR